MRLVGKVALISGGARGLGATIGRMFAQEGAAVALGDIREREGQETARQIASGGGKAIFVKLDVTKEEDWQRAVQATVQTFGALNVLVNNAGIYQPEPVVSTPLETWYRVMEVNATGVFLGCKAAIPAMKQAGGGSIINISSVAGLIGTGRGSAYPASKAVVRMITKSVAIQHAKDGIRANSIHPALTDTDMAQEWFFNDPSVRDAYLADIPLGRFGKPEDIGYAALYLASDESSFMTGAELVLDGGRTAK